MLAFEEKGALGRSSIPPYQGGPWRLPSYYRTGGGGGVGWGVLLHYFQATKRTGGFSPSSTSGDSTCASVFRSSVWRPSILLFRVYIRVGGWCCWISRMSTCMCWFIHLIGGIFGLEFGGEAHCLLMERSPHWLSHCPHDLHPAPGTYIPVVAHLHLQGILAHPHIDKIFHAQASFPLACRTHDINLHCHFALGSLST